MKKTRFSIVVTTRNRFETLKYCLKTCLHQDFQNYEVIVSDNSDHLESVETRKIIDELNAAVIKYFKPDAVLSMTANFEFALSKCTGEYILCIGDDDGLIPDCLTYVNALIDKYGASVIKSPVIVYHWKNALQTPNIFYLPYPIPVSKIDSRSILEKVARFELGYFNLPMIYYSFVSKNIVDKVVAAQGSFFGNAGSFDIYSGLVVAYHTTDFMISDQPFVIAGVSGKSNGIAEQKSLDNPISKEHYQKTGLNEMYQSYQVPQLPNYNLQLLSLLELVKFKKNFLLNDEQIRIVPKKVMVKLLSNKSVIENIRSLGLSECFRQYDIYKEDITDIQNNFLEKEVFFPFLENMDIQIISYVKVDPSLFCVEDVYDAALVLKKILDGYSSVKPVPVTIGKEQDAGSTGKPSQFIKKYFKRIKRAGKIVLRGHK